MWCEQEVTALQKLLSFIYLFRFTSNYAFRLNQSHVALKNSLGSSDIFILTFMHRASCIQDKRFATLQRTLFII